MILVSYFSRHRDLFSCHMALVAFSFLILVAQSLIRRGDRHSTSNGRRSFSFGRWFLVCSSKPEKRHVAVDILLFCRRGWCALYASC